MISIKISVLPRQFNNAITIYVTVLMTSCKQHSKMQQQAQHESQSDSVILMWDGKPLNVTSVLDAFTQEK
jgi:lysophospholipid acyltransferase (LPLAT)-like uncharacterized protein